MQKKQAKNRGKNGKESDSPTSKLTMSHNSQWAHMFGHCTFIHACPTGHASAGARLASPWNRDFIVF
jgi:hypothetical protein